MDVAVQWVRVYWTRRTRGAPGASRRSALPEAFPLAEAAPPFVHEVWMSEVDGYVPHSQVSRGLPPVTEMELTEADGLLMVRPTDPKPPEWTTGGLDITWRPRIALRPRQTLRWQSNKRFAAEWGWYYRLDTLNVAYCTTTGEVFMQPPTRRIDERSWLYGRRTVGN
jgi:hypothetical protein